MEGTERIDNSPAKTLHSNRNKRLVSCYQGVSMRGQHTRGVPILFSISSRPRCFDLVKQSSTSVVNDKLHAKYRCFSTKYIHDNAWKAEHNEAEEAWLEAVQTAALRIGRLNCVNCPIPKATR